MAWLPIQHYYGDIVRRLFLIASIIILLSLPLFYSILSDSILTFIIAVLVFGFLAGLTDPLKQKVALFDTCISALALVVFAYNAVHAYTATSSILSPLFLVNEMLAILFFFALYYSVKTLRGMFLE